MTDRWIRTSVGLFDPNHDLHPMGRHEAACAAFAWQELIGMARWKDGGGLLRGQLRVSQRFLSVRWMWSRDRVTRFLGELEQTGRITRDNTRLSGHGQGHEPATLTICNYELYQGVPTTNKASGKDADKDADKAKEVISTSTKKKKPTATRMVETWVTRCVEAWKPHGYVSHPQLGGLFKPLVTEFGEGEVVRRFQLFASNGKAQYGLGFFRSHFHDFDKGDPMDERSPYASDFDA